jgi:hypothetical protein
MRWEKIIEVETIGQFVDARCTCNVVGTTAQPEGNYHRAEQGVAQY